VLKLALSNLWGHIVFPDHICTMRWWAPWLSVHIFSHFHTVSRWSRDCITCHRHHTTYPDLCWSVAIISAHLRWFAMIFTAEVLQFSRTVAKDTGMSGYQNSKAVSAYRFGLTSVWWFRDIMIVAWARNRHYELDMVILKVGLLRKPPVLCTSGKIYQLSSFSF